MPLLWKKGKNKGEGSKLGDVIAAQPIDFEAGITSKV